MFASQKKKLKKVTESEVRTIMKSAFQTGFMLLVLALFSPLLPQENVPVVGGESDSASGVADEMPDMLDDLIPGLRERHPFPQPREPEENQQSEPVGSVVESDFSFSDIWQDPTTRNIVLLILFIFVFLIYRLRSSKGRRM